MEFITTTKSLQEKLLFFNSLHGGCDSPPRCIRQLNEKKISLQYKL